MQRRLLHPVPCRQPEWPRLSGRVPRGDFGLWNDLKARGHEVMPHGYKHANKASIPLAEAKDLILSLPGAEGYMCDVSKDEDIARLFEQLKSKHGKLHALVHSVAYAPAEELKGDFINTTREGFRIAHDVSVYSLIAASRAAAPLMEDGGSIITMVRNWPPSSSISLTKVSPEADEYVVVSRAASKTSANRVSTQAPTGA